MNTDLITINQADLDAVQELCDSIDNTELKNKAVANALAVKVAAKYFQSSEFTADDKSGIYKFLYLLDDAEVTDLYINGCYVDVRIYFTSEEIGVPQIHFEKGLKPLAYMFVKISPELTSASVTGFIRPNNVRHSQSDNGFYHVNEKELVSFDNISPYINYEEEDNGINDEILF